DRVLARPARPAPPLDRRAPVAVRCARGSRRDPRPSRTGRARRPDVPARLVAALRLAPSARRLDLDRRAGRPARPLDGAPTFPAGGRTGRLRSPLLERRLHLGTDPDRLGNRGRVVPPADTRLSLADLVRRGPPRQD